jgi:uncharacterized protein (TIGR01370 family)
VGAVGTKRLIAALSTLAGALLFAPAPAAAGGADDPLLAGVENWAFGIGNGMLTGDAQAVSNRLGGFDLLIVDGEEATEAELDALHNDGAVVLAYFSVGTIEKWRGWFDRVKRFRLEAWKDWKDEWFADMSKPKLRSILAGDIAPKMLAKGFDGLFLDNADMIEARRHRDERAGMRKLVKAIASLVHARDGLLFAQNGEWGLEKFGIVRFLDGWNREDVTRSYDFNRKRYVATKKAAHRSAMRGLKRYRNQFGLFTTATDYTKHRTGADVDKAIENACFVGALPYVSDINLTAGRLPDPPLGC